MREASHSFLVTVRTSVAEVSSEVSKSKVRLVVLGPPPVNSVAGVSPPLIDWGCQPIVREIVYFSGLKWQVRVSWALFFHIILIVALLATGILENSVDILYYSLKKLVAGAKAAF